MSNVNKKFMNPAAVVLTANSNRRNSNQDIEMNSEMRDLLLGLRKDISEMKKEMNDSIRSTDQKLDKMG